MIIRINCYYSDVVFMLLIMREIPTTSRFRRPQKGIGVYRSRDLATETARAAISVRRWWWEFLRLSKDYWLICQTSSSWNARTKDERLARVYRDFGNVFDCTFEQWWERRGAAIFWEETEAPRVREIEGDYFSRKNDRGGTILLEIPVALTKLTAQRQIGKILKNHQALRPKNVLELSTSRYPINPVRYQLATLQRMHEVWCLHRELIRKPKTLGGKVKNEDEKNDLFRIGKLLDLSYEYVRPSADEQEMHAKQRKMRVIVSRYLRRANQLIANVEYGEFPVFKDVSISTPRFSKHHLDRHDELEEEWWNTDLFSTLTTTSAEAAKRIYCSYYRIV